MLQALFSLFAALFNRGNAAPTSRVDAVQRAAGIARTIGNLTHYHDQRPL